MASINSATYTAQTTDPKDTTNNLTLGRPVVYYEATIATAANFTAADDTANLFKVPKGLRCVPELSSITCEALGTTATLHIGDDDAGNTADADRYSASTDVHAAASVNFSGGVASLTPVTTTTSTTIIATLVTADTITLAKKITIKMAFVRI